MKAFIDVPGPLGAGVNVVFYVKQPQCVRQAYGLVAYGFPWSLITLYLKPFEGSRQPFIASSNHGLRPAWSISTLSTVASRGAMRKTNSSPLSPEAEARLFSRLLVLKATHYSVVPVQ